MSRKSVFNHLSQWKMVAVLGALALAACSSKVESEAGAATVDALAFEKEYVKTLGYESDESIKLIGFKKITIPQDEVESFNAAYALSYKETHKNYLWDKSTGVLTVYFPVESALVEADGGVVEASTLGELQLDTPHDRLSVLGRRQTDTITGVEGNIIKDGIIYLAEKNTSIRRFGQVFVFDFGIKALPAHHQHDTTGSVKAMVDDKVSCMSNHGGLNCSNAFGIYQGRCPFNSSVCMDYNGWFTNCQNGNTLNFPGSDCDYALGAGHCWNEIM